MSRPLISVLIPMYNAANFILQAVNSVLHQTYDNLEIVIMDNCSTDNSVDIVEAIQDSRIKLYQNETNIGLNGNINKGLEFCSGEYIKFLCADDELCEDAIEKLYNFSQNHKCDLIYCNCKYIDENNNYIYDKAAAKKSFIYDYNEKNAISILTGKSKILCCVSFLFLRNIYDNIKLVTVNGSGYNSDLVYLFDNFKKYGKIMYSNERLILLRRHSGQGTYVVNGVDIFNGPLMFYSYIKDKHHLVIKGCPNFKYRFNIFKNGCNAYLKYQHKIPKSVFKYTLSEFGIGYYLLLLFYIPFVYFPKKIYNKVVSRNMNRSQRENKR